MNTQTGRKFFKKNVGVEGVHTMENKDTNTDYQKFVRVGDLMWEIVEITISMIFLLDIHIHYFLYSEFSSQVPPEKTTPPKMPNPTQNPDLI